jgi:hypothetical protein
MASMQDVGVPAVTQSCGLFEYGILVAAPYFLRYSKHVLMFRYNGVNTIDSIRFFGIDLIRQ